MRNSTYIKGILLIATALMLGDAVLLMPHYEDLTQVEAEKDSSEEEKEKEESKEEKENHKIVKALLVDLTRSAEQRLAFIHNQVSHWQNPTLKRFGPPPQVEVA